MRGANTYMSESCERRQMTGGIISQLFRGRKLRRVVAIDNHAVDAPEMKRNETKRNETRRYRAKESRFPNRDRFDVTDWRRIRAFPVPFSRAESRSCFISR